MRKFLLLVLLLVSQSVLFAQSSGIAIQGIARDNDNNAKANANVTLSFDIYYLNPDNNVKISVFTETTTLLTDAFGVFSHILEPGEDNVPLFGSYQLYLSIHEGSDVIADEKLNCTPYAMSAGNGVPTGAIMPFIGVTAPAGWMLCDGRQIPVSASTLKLRNLLGASNTPNLKGMFLRGTGISSVNSQDGPALMATQGDQNKSHSHDKGTLKTVDAGGHTHPIYRTDGGEGGGSLPAHGGDVYGKVAFHESVMGEAGSHSHTINGSTASSGGNEARPVNYGVNYIIKI